MSPLSKYNWSIWFQRWFYCMWKMNDHILWSDVWLAQNFYFETLSFQPFSHVPFVSWAVFFKEFDDFTIFPFEVNSNGQLPSHWKALILSGLEISFQISHDSRLIVAFIQKIVIFKHKFENSPSQTVLEQIGWIPACPARGNIILSYQFQAV